MQPAPQTSKTELILPLLYSGKTPSEIANECECSRQLVYRAAWLHDRGVEAEKKSCAICGATFTVKYGKQKTCLDPDCRRKYKKKMENRYRARTVTQYPLLCGHGTSPRKNKKRCADCQRVYKNSWRNAKATFEHVSSIDRGSRSGFVEYWSLNPIYFEMMFKLPPTRENILAMAPSNVVRFPGAGKAAERMVG